MELKKAMVYGSFIGDSLSLGVHWIYNVKAIEKRVGRIDELIAPVVKTFHPTKDAGEFTHYGDQMLLLLEFCIEESRAGKGGAAPGGTGSATGSMDHASKDTLASFRKMQEAGKRPEGIEVASHMDDLAGASRIAPVLYCSADNPEAAIEAAKAQAGVTHNEASVAESAAFFAELTLAALEGESPVAKARELIDGEYRDGALSELVRRGLESAGRDTTETIGEFGQACAVEKGLPSVMHLIATYEESLKEALVASVMAGGDSAARNHAVGMILGAYRGVDDIPEKWFSALAAKDRIEELL